MSTRSRSRRRRPLASFQVCLGFVLTCTVWLGGSEQGFADLMAADDAPLLTRARQRSPTSWLCCPSLPCATSLPVQPLVIALATP